MIKKLIGAKILDVKKLEEVDELLDIITDKGVMHFYHDRDCCESVWLEDGFDDLKAIVGEKIINAEVIINHDEGEAFPDTEDSYTWTYYKISTLNHDCTLRFYGTSNGYYSEEVDLIWRKNKK